MNNFDDSSLVNKSYSHLLNSSVDAQHNCHLFLLSNSLTLKYSALFICHREIEACSHLIASLCSCLEQVLILKEGSEYGSLFPAGEHKAIGLFNTSACVNQYSFYGRCIGFHVCFDYLFYIHRCLFSMQFRSHELTDLWNVFICSTVNRCSRL